MCVCVLRYSTGGCGLLFPHYYYILSILNQNIFLLVTILCLLRVCFKETVFKNVIYMYMWLHV